MVERKRVFHLHSLDSILKMKPVPIQTANRTENSDYSEFFTQKTFSSTNTLICLGITGIFGCMASALDSLLKLRWKIFLGNYQRW